MFVAFEKNLRVAAVSKGNAIPLSNSDTGHDRLGIFLMIHPWLADGQSSLQVNLLTDEHRSKSATRPVQRVLLAAILSVLGRRCYGVADVGRLG
jgi:hypothetical protein